MTDRQRERVLLVGLEITGRAPGGGRFDAGGAPESLLELKALAGTAGAEVTGQIIQPRPAIDAATLIGSGKVEEVSRRAAAEEAGTVIFDHDLTPTQLRNLEQALDRKVLDRTQLILDIFAGRARTREGQLQVELAQLNYLLPRLTGRGAAMSRLGGGIGTRGPGETQLETDRRRISRRIQKIKEQLASVRRTRTVQRRQRQGIPLAGVAMVGYTNAGKSTLFNQLTGAGVAAGPRLFATLDPTSRLLVLPSRRRAVLSDTVGFIRHLPTTLVQAFRATLEEVTEADLLLHVVDASSSTAEAQAVQVFEVLHEIEASNLPQVLVLNKMDRLEEGVDAQAILHRILGGLPEKLQATSGTSAHRRAVAVSALTGEGLPDLLATIDEVLPTDPLIRSLYRLPADAGRPIHLLHEYANVLSKKYSGDECVIDAEVPESVHRRLRDYQVPEPAVGSAKERAPRRRPKQEGRERRLQYSD